MTLAALAGGLAVVAVPRPIRSEAQTTPIQHVVIIYQENHSFDNVLGRWCVMRRTGHCDGATFGKASNGRTVPLSHTPDIVPNEGHGAVDQRDAIHGGKMDQFDQVAYCGHLSCYSQYHPRADLPTLLTLAGAYAISDRTFTSSPTPSFGAHVELVAATLDGFSGNNPENFGPPPGGKPGWGCDSGRVTRWHDPVTGFDSLEPACVPFPDGSGTFLPYSPVPHVNTIMDVLQNAGLSWKLYATGPSPSNGTTAPGIPYGWAICPTFADCLETSQKNNMVDSSQAITDAQNGTLPNFSVVLPNNDNSQHNFFSMMQGDNWIEQVVSAIMQGPDWGSTAIFITYDDCGCFYDHVPPPAADGPRVPMVIVSPYARAGFTDSTDATFASMLAYTEHAFDLPSLGGNDYGAYDFTNSFDYTQTPLPPVPLSQHPVPAASKRYVATHVVPPDGT